MRKFVIGLLVAGMAGAMASCATAQSGASADAASVAAALADPSRPATDVARDARRKPAEMVAFAGIKPGMKVVDYLPGGGYFTRVFAKVVGPKGKVYAVSPPGRNGNPPAVVALAASPGYENVQVVPVTNMAAFAAPPEKVDLIWTSRNYHDLVAFNADVPGINKAIFDSLKRGGIYIVLDHAAAADTGVETPALLHRISPALVKQQVTAAGFQFVGESTVLRNPQDDVTKRVFEEGVPDSSDQFIYKFRKP